LCFTAVCGELAEIGEFPSDGGQTSRVCEPGKSPVDVAAFDANEERTMCFGHLRNHDIEHFLARGNQLVQSDWRCSHAPEVLLEICTDIASVWRKHLDRRSIVAHNVGEECLPQGLGYALFGQKIPDVEKVAGVLTIKRRDKLAGIEIVEGDDLGFGVSERVFDGRRDLHRSGSNTQPRITCVTSILIWVSGVLMTRRLTIPSLCNRLGRTFACGSEAEMDFDIRPNAESMSARDSSLARRGR